MIRARLILVASLVLAAAAIPMRARAATCTVNGTVQINSWDSYYCDSSHLTFCAGWKEKDLDSATKTMKDMHIEVQEEPGGALLGEGWTNSSGYFSISFARSPSCSGLQFKVRYRFKMVNTADPEAPRTGRFRIEKDTGATWSFLTYPANTFGTSPCSSSTCTKNKTFQRTTSDIDRSASIYYTAQSAISQIVPWSVNLNSRFSNISEVSDGTGMLRYNFDNSNMNGSFFSAGSPGPWLVTLDYEDYMKGMTVRHETGHAVHAAVHGRKPNGMCYSDRLLDSTPPPGTHRADSCEYGYAAMTEGIAEFFAVRSMVVTDTNQAFSCRCHDESTPNQDTCSETAPGALADDDRILGCTGFPDTGFKGLGDDFVTQRTQCVRVASLQNYGCHCDDFGTPPDGFCDTQPSFAQPCPDAFMPFGVCDNHEALGWRNESNIARFFWDVLDPNNEANDNDTYSISSIVADLEAMACDASVFGDDDTCNEPNEATSADCTPAETVIPFTLYSTRDAYNVWDVASVLTGDQSLERWNNCVDLASD